MKRRLGHVISAYSTETHPPLHAQPFLVIQSLPPTGSYVGIGKSHYQLMLLQG